VSVEVVALVSIDDTELVVAEPFRGASEVLIVIITVLGMVMTVVTVESKIELVIFG